MYVKIDGSRWLVVVGVVDSDIRYHEVDDPGSIPILS